MIKFNFSNKMLNFTVGPVNSGEYVLDIGKYSTPYFRTQEFSDLMIENEKLMKKFVKASNDSRVVFITGSGTAAMEATVSNLFDENDKILVINGGSFGNRFVEICELYKLDHTQIKLKSGNELKKEDLCKFDGKGYTGMLVNIHETSTGVYYDLDLISEFCKKNNIFLVIDAISSFLADPLNMKEANVGAVITSSQKALACPPGISIIVLSKDATNRIDQIKAKSMYFNLKTALNDGERGQTPYTPAVTILLQLNARLNMIEERGGVDEEIKRIETLAKDFRQKINGLPFKIASKSMSNAVTPLHPTTQSAYKIFLKLKDEYNIWINPNGGEMKDSLLRVGHIGEMNINDNDKLIAALNDLKEKRFI